MSDVSELDVPHPVVDDTKQTLNLDRLKAWEVLLRAALADMQDEIDAALAGIAPDATTTVKGKVKLAGDLGGTADAPTVPGLAGRQPLDADLTAIAALTTTSYGRSLLTQADGAAVRTLISAAAAVHTHVASDVTDFNTAVRSNRLDQMAAPAANIPMSTRKLTGLLQGSVAGDSVEYAQFIAGIIAAQMGFQLKSAVSAVSIQALPAHGRVGNVLTASANGFLAPSFGSLKFSWASGTFGTGNGQLDGPYDVALDSSGNIFVLDVGNNRVQKFNSSGVYQSKFTTGISTSGMAIDSADNIWVLAVSDLIKYNSAGVLQGSYSLSSAIGFGSPAVYGTSVYIPVFDLSASGPRIHKYNTSGVFQSSFGATGSGNGQFANYPGAIACDSSGNIYVADSGNHRVQKFNSSGTYLSKFGSEGTGPGEFKAPNGIEVDSSGNIWVSDYFNNRVQKFNSSGTFQEQFGGPGSGNGQFVGPRGIAVTSGGDLIIADSINNRIQRFGAFTLSANDTVLVRHEGSGTHVENTIYTVTNPGSAGTKWVLTLRDDMGPGYAKNQSLVIALTENGQQNRVFTLNTSDPITVWTTPLTWSRFEPGGPPSPHASNHLPGGTDPLPGLGERVTALPSTPVDGQEVYFDTGQGLWHLRYNASAPGSYKWEFIGGPALRAESINARSLTNQTTFVSLPTDPLSIQIPLSGDYEFGAFCNIQVGAAGFGRYSFAYDSGGTNATSVSGHTFLGASGGASTGGRERVLTGVTAGNNMAEKALTGGNYTVTFANRSIYMRPVRVG